MTSNLPVPEWFDAKAIFAKFEQGKTSDAIAQELGVRRVDLVKQLKKHPEDFREIRAALQYVRLEDALDEQDAAAEAGDYSKVRCFSEVIKSAQWELERVHRQVYGEQKEPPASPVQININLRRDETKVIEAEPSSVLEALKDQKVVPEPDREESKKPKKENRTVYVPPSPKNDQLSYPDSGFI